MSAPAPLLADLHEPLTDCERHPDRAGGVILLGCRVVEEHHDFVAREMLEGAFVLDHERPDHRVVPAQEPEHLLRLGRLRERGEVAQIAEHRGDLAAVARQERLALGARHERRDLWRQEPGELTSLALDRLQQSGVRDADGRLFRKAGRERLLPRRKRG